LPCFFLCIVPSTVTACVVSSDRSGPRVSCGLPKSPPDNSRLPCPTLNAVPFVCDVRLVAVTGQVQEALDAQKEEFARKEEAFRRREEALRKKDLDLQESLIRFNKFLQVGVCACLLSE
jgi:hypothetical protein